MATSSLLPGPRIVAELRRLFAQSPYLALHGIDCELCGGVVALQGRVPSYYLKQVALSVTTRVQGDLQIDDQIEVAVERDPPRARSRCDRSRRTVMAAGGPSLEDYCPWISPHLSRGRNQEVVGSEDDRVAADRPLPLTNIDLLWLREAAEDGDLCAMYRLGTAARDSDTRNRWLRSAAQGGCIPAIHECALQSEDPREAIHWLREAAEEGYRPAMYDYARVCESPGERAYWLRRASHTQGRRVPR